MLPLSQRVLFAVFAVVMLVLGARGFYRMYRRIARGRADADGRLDHVWTRVWYALRTTLLQTRVFRKRVVLSVFHSFIFYAFVLYLLVNAVDAVDGYVELQPMGTAWMQALYGVLTDAFSVLAIVGVVVFVLRRWVFGARRDFAFNELTLLQPAVKRGYIARDSAIVSAFILFHVSSRIVGNSALVDAGRLKPLASGSAVTFHDPCYLGRHRGSYEEPRALLRVLSAEVVEMPRTKSNAFCCGAGGAQFWKEEERGTERVSENRFAEAQGTLAASDAAEKILAVGCPFCKSMLASTPASGADGAVAVKDVAELLWEGVLRGKRGAGELAVARAPLGAEPLHAAAAVEKAPPVLTPEQPQLVKEVSLAKAAEEPALEAAMESAPLRKKWSPKGVAKTEATPVVEENVLAPAPAMADAAELSAARKEWAPREKIAPAVADQGALLEDGVEVPAIAEEAMVARHDEVASDPEITAKSRQEGAAPLRKKWQPKKG